MPTPRNFKAVRKVTDVAPAVFTELTNVLTLSIDVGRTGILDTFQPSRASFTYRRLSGSTPVPEIDDTIYLVDYTTGSTAQQIAENNKLLFVGRVQDATIQWGIDADSDVIVVQCEGALAELGRNVISYNFSHDNLADYIDTIEAQSGDTIALYNAGADVEIHQVQWDGSVADLLRTIARTTYGRIVELDNAVALLAGNYTQSSTWKFTDAGTGTYQVYQDIEYESLADNYYTKIIVEYPNNNTATAGTGARALSVDTLARNATDASTLANYYKTTYGSPVMGLARVSALASAQGTYRLNQISTLGSYQQGLYNCVGTQMEVDFRGSTLTVIVEGFSISADPNDSRYTFYVSPGDLNSYLVLNNSVLGRLDFNKLGF